MEIEFLVVAADGKQVSVFLAEDCILNEPPVAPEWLVRQLDLPSRPGQSWQLLPLFADSGMLEGTDNRRLCLGTTFRAAATRAPFDPRQARLRAERERLEKLNQESDYVRVEMLNVLPGSEPEHYRVTLLCRGIIGIDSVKRPIYGDRHQVEIYCDDEFPSDVPRLRWITDIWHPNIQHNEPKGVCVNKAEWLGGMGLDDLVRLMFEMVQYKNYHAQFTPPYPLDMEVARWVIEYAEPRNVVNKGANKYVDNKPFTRPTVPQKISVTPVLEVPRLPRIKVLPPATPACSRIKVITLSPDGSSGEERAKVGSRIRVKK